MLAAGNRAFVDAWGAMGTSMGFNASTTRVHALLIASDQALRLDEITDELRISRGNASMCLKELRSWGAVRRVKKPGDRRDSFPPSPTCGKGGVATRTNR